MTEIKDKYVGCLLGGAAGDALGYGVEFLTNGFIIEKYGEGGIESYDNTKEEAEFSDDTQMTLFTAQALIEAGEKKDYMNKIVQGYKDWYLTQMDYYPINDGEEHNKLLSYEKLFSRRAPGNTCLSAIRQGCGGTLEKPINASKGCGGIMRVAPIGLYFTEEDMSEDEIALLGAKAAATTHGHELGYMPSAAFVHIIHSIVHKNMTIPQAVDSMKVAMARIFEGKEHLGKMLELIEKAQQLAKDSLSDYKAIRQLGEGWVAEETLAVAIYCALKYSEDFSKGIIAAVNHDGDSDSTGAVAGNIIGAYLGKAGIDKKYTDTLELRDLIIEVAENLCKNN